MRIKEFLKKRWRNVAIVLLLINLALGVAMPALAEVVIVQSRLLEASAISVEELGTATYDDVQDFINQYGNRGTITGFAVTCNLPPDGTVAVAAGTGWAKTTDSINGVGAFFDFVGDASTALTDNSKNYIYLDYNGGTPVIAVDITGALAADYDHILLASSWREGNEVHLLNVEYVTLDTVHKALTFANAVFGVRRTSGLVATSTGTRQLAISSGTMYASYLEITSLSYDTSSVASGTVTSVSSYKLVDSGASFTANDVGKTVKNTIDTTYTTVCGVDSGTTLSLHDDIFPAPDEADGYQVYDSWSSFYTSDSGSTWAETEHVTQIDNTYYNAIASGLIELTANRYAVHWLYTDYEGQHLFMVYGQGDYTAPLVEAAGVPSVLPPVVVEFGVLIAKIICQKGTDTLTISYPWTSVFTSSLATDHGSLAGLTDDDHPQYLLTDGSRDLTGDINFAEYKAVALVCDNGATAPAAPTKGQWFLHTPTGRNVLMQYDGSNWFPIMSMGTMTMYVDTGTGSDSIDQGGGVTTDAFDTLQYAIDQIPGLFGGSVTITMTAETYSESITIRGKNPTGSYTITIQGTLSSQESATADSMNTGTGATQGILTDTGAFAGDTYGDMLLHVATLNEYRLIDSHTDDVITIVGTFTGSGAYVWTVYDWGTSIDGAVALVGGQKSVYFNDIHFSGGHVTGASFTEFRLTRCKVSGAYIIQSTGGTAIIDTVVSLSTGYAQLVSQFNSYIVVPRSKFAPPSTTTYVVRAIAGTVYLQIGTIIDGERGVAADVPAGAIGELNGSILTYSTAADGYVRIRNCTIGLNAVTGAQIAYTTNNVYAGNGADETATAASFGYID